MDILYRNRKFQLAVFFTIADTIAFFFGLMNASEFIMSQGIILGLYGAVNVASKDKK